MRVLVFIAGLALIIATLLDGFETILIPRRINRRFRYARLYYRGTWNVWRALAAALPGGRIREAMLVAFGPLSLLGLFASWILVLIVGFASLQWGVGALVSSSGGPAPASFVEYLYFSGTTYFTLGLGEIIPQAGWSRFLTVLECGLGFGFLAVILSYLPVLYQAFSKRELTISLLDARAGSPPSGGECIRRLYCQENGIVVDQDTLRQWEQWSAELLESHLSFPVLAFYRSQHANQSWLAALKCMLDASAMLLTLLPEGEAHQARLTFAMARHAAVDIALIFSVRRHESPSNSPKASEFSSLEPWLASIGHASTPAHEIESKLAKLRAMYEPFLDALSGYFMVSLPPAIPAARTDDNWQRSPWMARTPGLTSLPSAASDGEHFG
jgi:hypothetical protein